MTVPGGDRSLAHSPNRLLRTYPTRVSASRSTIFLFPGVSAFIGAEITRPAPSLDAPASLSSRSDAAAVIFFALSASGPFRTSDDIGVELKGVSWS